MAMAAPTAPDRPPAPNFARIPQDLQARDQWVCWAYALRGDKWTKVPQQVDGRAASSTDPATWTTFAGVVAAYASGAFDGIGFVFSADDPCVGIDLDHCLTTAGQLEPWAAQVLQTLPSYTEVTPSGSGLHIICHGTIPGPRRRKGSFEMYSEGRFFTMTGAHWLGSPKGVADGTAGLAVLYAAYFPPEPPPIPAAPSGTSPDLSDADILRLARAAKNNAKFTALYDRGDTSEYPSGSEADLALCSLLAFYTQDAAQLERLVSGSVLGRRAKWQERAVYRSDTINKALAGQHETFGSRPAAAAPTDAPVTVTEDQRAPQPLADGFPPGDVGNAQRFIHYFGPDVRYTLEWGWLVWDGQRWARDTTGLVRLKAQGLRDAVIRHALQLDDRRAGDDLLTLAKKLGQTATINNLLTEAAPMAAVRTLDFDRNPWLLNCANGTLNLQTGTLHPHRREDLLSRVTVAPYEAQAVPNLWKLFIYRVFAGDVGVINFMQRALGYSITGSTREQALFIMYGSGSNGKSTLWGTVQRLLGDYGLNTPVKTLLRKERDSGINNDVARMVGARFVTASEPDVGKHLDVATVKDLTGGDPITARFLNKEYFTFDPILKIWLSTNHKPIIRDTTNSIWRRINLIPFTVKFSDGEKDVDLPDKLMVEAPAILAWLVEGCQRWLASGLAAPESVRAAGEAYRQEMDPLGPFLREYCDVGKTTYTVFHKSLYSAYCNWCEESGEKPVSRRALTDMLTERGFVAEDGTGNLKTWSGIQLRTISN